MHKLFIVLILLAFSCSTPKKQTASVANVVSDAERILKTLSADDMQGRATFTPGAEKAASFIENEFRAYGLQPISGATSFRQTFNVRNVSVRETDVNINGRRVGADSLASLSDKAEYTISQDAKKLNISAGDNLFERYGEISRMNGDVIVTIDPEHAKNFTMLRNYLMKSRVVDQPNEQRNIVFILAGDEVREHNIQLSNNIAEQPLFNVVAILPGKSRAKEIVIFSAHYDHIGIQPAVDGDSIANGADDDASGVTAVLSLARYFSQLKNNERTLMFVTFAGEELGLVGSGLFSKAMNADEVTAMFNIEMIGKESKFGKRAAFITGYDRSDFGKILQKNLEGTSFTFHPDPYTEQNLFYRSDNASLAARGVPAHTISTDQIDKDPYYHTVNDEFETLDIENVKATIEAIALSARGIISGQDTPKRVPKLEESH